MNYIFRSPGKIAAGQGSIGRFMEHVPNSVRPKKALLIASAVIHGLGVTEHVKASLARHGISSEILAGVLEREPEIADITGLREAVSDSGCDLLIGVGGGSVLDGVKLLSVLAANDTPLTEMIGIDRIAKPGLPTILVPTTAGTGSEVTPNAIVTDPNSQLKEGIVSEFLLPVLAVLDPELTLSLPPAVTASTGMDAFTHALESYISNKANPFSDMFAVESMRLIASSLTDAYVDGNDIAAREKMLLGSMYGGMALTSAGTAAVHAMAYPLGGKFGIAHGTANAMLLPHVTEYQMAHLKPRIGVVAEAMGLGKAGSGYADPAAAVVDKLRGWTEEMRIPQKLTEFGVQHHDLEGLSIAAFQVKRLMANNPMVLSVADIRRIYSRLM